MLGNFRNTTAADSGSIGGVSGITHVSECDDMLTNLLQVEHKRLVRKSWSDAISEDLGGPAPVATLIESFYRNFFALSPEAKLLFRTDPMHQTKAISGALSRMLVYLDNGDRLRKQMRELAKQHYNMGIAPEMFDCFGRALVQTLKERLGNEWTPQTETAWVQTFDIVKKIIVDNMEELTFQSSNMPKWLKRSYATDRPLLKATWQAATTDGGAFLDKFFQCYFAKCPEAKPLFQGRIDMQGKALFGAVATLFSVMETADKLEATLKRLGKTHAKMGVTADMCYEFGAALLDTLQATLKDAYTMDVEVVWRRALRLVVNGMVKATDHANSKAGKDCVVQ